MISPDMPPVTVQCPSSSSRLFITTLFSFFFFFFLNSSPRNLCPYNICVTVSLLSCYSGADGCQTLRLSPHKVGPLSAPPLMGSPLSVCKALFAWREK